MNSIHHGWSLDEIAPEARRAAERAAEAAGMPLEIWLNQLIKYVSAMELSGKGPARARAIDETIKRAAAEQAKIGSFDGPAGDDPNAPMMLDNEAPELPTTLPAEMLQPNRFAEGQPGERDVEQAIGEWRKSGALPPLVVRPDTRKPGHYEIVSGMERWHAASRLHMRRIPVTVKAMTDEEVLRATLIQKLAHKSLPPLDEAQIYQRLMEETGLSVADLSNLVGRSPTHVATALQLLELPEPVRELINGGALSVLHARTLLGAADPEPAAREVVARRLDIYQTEQLVRASHGALAQPQRAGAATGNERAPAAQAAAPEAAPPEAEAPEAEAREAAAPEAPPHEAPTGAPPADTTPQPTPQPTHARETAATAPAQNTFEAPPAAPTPETPNPVVETSDQPQAAGGAGIDAVDAGDAPPPDAGETEPPLILGAPEPDAPPATVDGAAGAAVDPFVDDPVVDLPNAGVPYADVPNGDVPNAGLANAGLPNGGVPNGGGDAEAIGAAPVNESAAPAGPDAGEATPGPQDSGAPLGIPASAGAAGDGPPGDTAEAGAEAPERSADGGDDSTRMVETHLSTLLGLKVSIAERNQDDGVLSIHYNSENELTDLVSRLNRMPTGRRAE